MDSANSKNQINGNNSNIPESQESDIICTIDLRSGDEIEQLVRFIVLFNYQSFYIFVIIHDSIHILWSNKFNVQIQSVISRILIFSFFIIHKKV